MVTVAFEQIAETRMHKKPIVKGARCHETIIYQKSKYTKPTRQSVGNNRAEHRGIRRSLVDRGRQNQDETAARLASYARFVVKN